MTAEQVYDRHGIRVMHGEALDALAQLDDASADSVICDPPYGLGQHTPAQVVTALTAWANGDRTHVPDGRGFLSAAWDSFVPPPAVWDECLRVLKPGGYLLAFAGSRTIDLMALSVRLAGFEIRDTIMWLSAAGFPKNLDVAKAIDKAAGAEREVIGQRTTGIGAGGGAVPYITDGNRDLTAPATDDAKRWSGWGTSLRPSHEPLVVAQKPIDSLARVLSEVGAHLDRLETECASSAKPAPTSSTSHHPTAHEGRAASAREGVATPPEAAAAQPTGTGAAAGTSTTTGTSTSESAPAATSGNIVTSWRKCWDELCEQMSTSTTATTSEQITDLRTLSCYLQALTPESMAGHPSQRHGPSSVVAAVDNLFGAVVLRSRAIHARSVTEPATEPTRTSPPGAADPAASSASPHEAIVMARKPLGGTVAGSVLAHGTGAINVDGCRIPARDGGVTVHATRTDAGRGEIFSGYNQPGPVEYVTPSGGRWPANVLLGHAERCESDGCDRSWCPVAELDHQSGISSSPTTRPRSPDPEGGVTYNLKRTGVQVGHGDSGGASRFFQTFRYESKAPTSERPMVNGNAHPTTKPLALMRWCVKLVTQPGGLVLDPFAGSGTTGHAARAEGMRALLIEREADYLPLIRARLDARARTPATSTGEVSGDEPLDLLDLLDTENP